MSEVANIYKNLVPENKETYAGKIKRFEKIKLNMRKHSEKSKSQCSCEKKEDCGCKK